MSKTLKDACLEIGVPYKTVYNYWVKSDGPKISGEKVGRTIVIADVEKLRREIEALGITPRSSRGVKKGSKEKNREE